MGNTFRLAIGIFVIALGLSFLHARPASAKDAQQGTASAAGAVNGTDTSAHRKRRGAPRTAAPAPVHPVWTGSDPTKGPGIAQVRELQRQGRCIIDEGYGRWTACSNM